MIKAFSSFLSRSLLGLIVGSMSKTIYREVKPSARRLSNYTRIKKRGKVVYFCLLNSLALWDFAQSHVVSIILTSWSIKLMWESFLYRTIGAIFFHVATSDWFPWLTHWFSRFCRLWLKSRFGIALLAIDYMLWCMLMMRDHLSQKKKHPDV